MGWRGFRPSGVRAARIRWGTEVVNILVSGRYLRGTPGNHWRRTEVPGRDLKRSWAIWEMERALKTTIISLTVDNPTEETR
jgi:hypothetical protein